ncbi:TonB-dependent receptor [Methylocystis sp. H4A]|uniref:TonB-dependent receptor plug domain-containing protein n=1 Tax=Methylocystis sp. H4A TaxID=2785788 RepID=UPI001FED717C|nr:TonB-dependent receptor [Methylocystis sp. H4A]
MMTRLLTTTAISGGVLLALSIPMNAQTPLPPIEVRAPKAFELGQIKVGERRLGVPTKVAQPGAGAGGGGVGAPPPAWVPSEKTDNGPTPSQHTDAFGGYTITNRQMETFARPSLDSAVNIAPGVNSQISGNSRNEQNIYVRGFDRWQVPLTVDGVRVYLPVDNRLDFARFLTADIAEVQIAKGYVSVLDGPGGMGGQINLVTRRPTREIEAEWRTRFDFGRDGTFLGPMTYGFVGTKKDMYYAQLSGTFQNYDGWMLPASYRSTLAQGWGFRGQSHTQDYNINARVGVTPNATDEYSLSFSRQEGQKGAPLHTTDPISTQRFWRWPYWRVQNLYFLSKTQLGDSSYVKTRGYWSKFDNSLVSYDDPSFIKQSLPRSFNSAYADYALGAEAEVGTQIGDIDTLKALFFYRLDNHSEWQENFGQNFRGTRSGCVTSVPCYTQPVISSIEDTYSAAVENTFHPRQDIDIVAGFSYDWRHLRQAQGFAVPQGVIDYRPIDVQAPNYQGAAIWRYNDTDRVYFNGSSRTRYPTLFERFSTRFGGATSNPTLKPERATNFDLGWSSLFAPGGRVSIDVFYSLVDNLIQSVPAPQFGVNVTQSQNVGGGRFWGAEISADYFVREDFSLGGNVTLIRRRVNSPSIVNFQPTGVPDLKMFLYAGYRPIPQLTLTPSIEVAGARWTSITNGNWYYRTGAFCLTNFNADYTPGDNIKFSAGVRNAFDDYYVLADGYPSPGRTFYLASKVNF